MTGRLQSRGTLLRRRGAAAGLLALFVLACLGGIHGAAEAATNIFISRQGGYNTYRIPALYETTNGTLLAFCEGRKNSSSDTGDIDTLLRRSFDGGLTWTPQQVVWNDSSNTCGNPTVVQDRSNGRIWLFLTWNNGQDSQAEIQNGTSIDVRKIYSCYSDDDGATWSSPVNRFAQVQPASTRWDATGPGCGIQMASGPRAGRLIIPSNGRNIQSDDHGATWKQSTWLPSGTSESQEVEIAGAVLLRNDRASGSYAAYDARMFCRSTDQGATWGPIEVRSDLPCPVCQASTIAVRHPAGLNGRILVFSNPSATTRVNMTVQCSLDDGVTWPFSRQVYAGSSAYSCLTGISTNRIGLLYEADSYGRITFDRFTLEELVPETWTGTWSGGAGAGKESWLEAANWVSNNAPNFKSSLNVVFNAPGAASLTNAIGTNCVIRSLAFNASAAGGSALYLAESVTSPAVDYVLTFDAAGIGATNAISTNLTGDFTIGVGGSAGRGSIVLADDLIVNHDGLGELKFDRPISGPGGITKNGAGRLYLRQSNTYTGDTTINAGAVITGGNTGGFGDASTSGQLFLNGGVIANSSSASRPIYNDAIVGGSFAFGGLAGYGAGLLTLYGALDLGGANRVLTINSPVTVAGAVSNGGLSKSGAATLILSGANTYTGQTTIYAGILQLGDGAGSGSLDPASTVAIGPNGVFQYNRTNNLGSFTNGLIGVGTFSKTNSNEIGLTGSNSFSGTLDIQQGKIALSGAGCVNGAPSVNVGANGTLSLGAGFIGGTATIGNLGGTGRIDTAYSQGAGVRTLQVNQSVDGVFSGRMLDATAGRTFGFVKSGPATLTLSGSSNSYGGPTTLTGGTLVVSGAISNSPVTVRAGAVLAGTGLLTGPVTVEPGGTLAPGPLGLLTVANALTLQAGAVTVVEINTTNGQSVRVQGMTAVSYGGTLVVSNVAGPAFAPVVGQAFPIFSAVPSPSGNFTITPSPAAGLTWNFNPTNGVLSVVRAVATYPTNIVCGYSNGTLSLSWPASHLGWLAQSNSVGLASPGNWFDIPGSDALTNLDIVPAAAGSNVFYRLRSP
jgi:autotransporter-associated beta strand protein